MSREWNAAAYHRLSEPHVAWGRSVLERLDLRGDERAIDAGCGTGRLTGLLRARLPRGRLIALDHSWNMLRAARDHLTSAAVGPVLFLQADLGDLPVKAWADVVFSTATFHWVPDHERLFANLHAALTPGGLLIAQCGGAGNLAHIHEHAERVITFEPFRPFFEGWSAPWTFASPDTTAARLFAAGFIEIDTSLEPAPTTFPTEEAFAAFGATIVFRPFTARLPNEELKSRFVREVTRLASLDRVPFTYDYARLNLRARRPRVSGP